MKEELDKIESVVDSISAPERVMRWAVRIVILCVAVAVSVSVLRVAFHLTDKVEAVTTDNAWFASQYEAIRAAELERNAAQEALTRHQAEVDSRSGTFSFSRADDRAKSASLNQQILDAERRRLSLVQEYNSRAARAHDPSVLAGLPAHIDLSQE